MDVRGLGSQKGLIGHVQRSDRRYRGLLRTQGLVRQACRGRTAIRSGHRGQECAPLHGSKSALKRDIAYTRLEYALTLWIDGSIWEVGRLS